MGKPPDQVRPADVLAFITAQRTGQVGERGALQPLKVSAEPGGVSAARVRRRLSIVSGFFAFLQARGDVAANPVPRGLPTRRERSRPGHGVPLVRAARRLPRILSPAGVDALTAALRTHRDRAMVAVMVLGGLRRCEVLGLRMGDLHVAERREFIAEGKGGRQRLVPVQRLVAAPAGAALVAESAAAALVVLGSRAHGRLHLAVVKSVGHTVLRSARSPVAIVRTPPRERTTRRQAPAQTLAAVAPRRLAERVSLVFAARPGNSGL